jgi:deoxyribodipyrimidine photolyase-related protein
VGGKWNFDQENRKKVPKAMLGNLPALPLPEYDAIDRTAREHVLAHYLDHPGSLDALYFPTSHEQAIGWLDDFLENRFSLFGDYEDAMVEGQNWLWHSVLTPMLNTGLLTPRLILDRTVRYADRSEVPLNALEGFIRQVIGWREFMRATYDDLGVSMRTTNHWGHRRHLPASFYEGTTGVLPVDDVIERVRTSGYCHHIERLMVLGGFMFLCEIDPDDIYRWFMEMFVDSYDWVMVPNVYAMSQHADGGQITTKPYFSGSSYIRKMSNYPRGEWAEIWDGLYWRWIWKHCEKLAKNPRWAMMCAMVRKMDRAKRTAHLQRAEKYLQRLDASLPCDVLTCDVAVEQR